MQGTGRTAWETLPCLLTFSLGSTGVESGRSRRHTGERAGSFELRRCMLVVAASRGRWFVTEMTLGTTMPNYTQLRTNVVLSLRSNMWQSSNTLQIITCKVITSGQNLQRYFAGDGLLFPMAQLLGRSGERTGSVILIYG
jgi:hypothetical protein